jgi:hypothetical protein
LSSARRRSEWGSVPGLRHGVATHSEHRTAL